jgi:hypothetical protein
MHGEEDEPRVGLGFVARFGHADAVELGHGDIKEKEIGLVLQSESQGFFAIAGFRDHFEPIGVFENETEALAIDGMVVSEDESEWSHDTF